MGDTRKKIMLVDDSRNFLTYISVLLRKLGIFRVVIAEGGKETLKLLEMWMPDIIILSREMPEMDGLETLSILKAKPQTRSIPVIMTTQSRDEKISKTCMRMGATIVMRKPVNLRSLNDAMQQCIVESGANRRKHLRTYFDKEVTIEHEGASMSLNSRTLSEGGIALCTSNPLPVGSVAKVQFELDDLNAVVEGEVIYHMQCPSDESAKKDGMAIRFKDMDETTTSNLKDFVEKLITDDTQKLKDAC